MARKTKNRRVRQDIGPVRRILVERLRVRGMSVREVTNALAAEVDKGGIRNPETGEPFSKSTIGRDFVLIDEVWTEALHREVPIHKREELAELREVRREAWRKGDLKSVMAALKLEIELLGTKEPVVDETKLTLGGGATYITFGALGD